MRLGPGLTKETLRTTAVSTPRRNSYQYRRSLDLRGTPDANRIQQISDSAGCRGSGFLQLAGCPQAHDHANLVRVRVSISGFESAGLSRRVKKVLVEERRFSAASDPTQDLSFQPL